MHMCMDMCAYKYKHIKKKKNSTNKTLRNSEMKNYKKTMWL